MTPSKIMMIAPIKIAITDVSPIVPAVFPISISLTLTLESPSFLMSASGVAPEYTSTPFLVTLKLVMSAANAMRRKHLPPSAGFIKFCPSPPNIHLTMMIANTPPSTASHHGSETGRFSAKSSPVTTALRSVIVLFFLTM